MIRLPQQPVFGGVAAWKALYWCAQVSTLWHAVSFRRALLVQLAEGQFGWDTEQGYPSFLEHVGRATLRLAAAEVGAAAAERQRLARLAFRKEQAPRNLFCHMFGPGFCKASGCTTARTVVRADGGGEGGVTPLASMCAEIKSLAEKVVAVKHERVKFNKETIRSLAAARCGSPEPDDIDRRAAQRWPPESEDEAAGRTVAEAADPAVLKRCILMYQQYFSPQLHYIFPLIVYRQAALGVDFGTVRTWCMFDKHRAPVGAVSWRIRRPPTAELCKAAGLAPAVAPVAEVLFIAVWERQRKLQYGSDLVDAVSSAAAMQGVRLLYVEIGAEQPKAIEFWTTKNGFEKLDRDLPVSSGVSAAQLHFLDSACFRFTDTEQYVRHM